MAAPPSPEPAGGRWPPLSYVAKIVLAVAAVAVLVLALGKISQLLVLAFGSVVFAVLIRALADPIKRHLHFGDGWSVAAAIALIALVLGLAGWLFGSQIQSQFANLTEMLPRAWADMQERVATLPGGEALVTALQQQPSGGDILSNLGRAVQTAGGAIVDFLLVLFGALFIAANPNLYRRGLLKLVPPSCRGLTAETMADSGIALRKWMLGQLVSMAVVGALTALGLWLVGVPAAIALGVVAGVLEFIPYAGPVLAAIPALMLALMQGGETALLALLVILAVQQVEGSLIMPIVQKQAVRLPPALTVFGVVGFGMLFGVPGLIFAAPLLVVAYVLVKRLYVQEMLDTETAMPGQEPD